ncbi:uncharacterized protein [Amphiura filiformis]|uniref:uncharacterized protein n=1 Tax=Amphiura filiformis TaxID=82378 RepID=UPI003B21B1B0
MALMVSMMEKRNILTPGELKEFENDKFPFENIAFEGGGSKGTAHIGAVRVLEEIGVWKNLKRFAGTSAGAMVAMCGALGYDSHEMEQKMADGGPSKNATCKYLAFLPNMLTHYGWHPGKKMEKWIGEVLKEKLGNANATFEDLYKKYNRELCVVVSNVNQLDCLYCHVKTTPCMKIKEAVRMSISIPGVLFPVKHKDQYFVDGGLINNYPIRVFDGWYLSMKPQDNFLIRIPEFGNLAAAWDPNTQFGDQPNGKTIGVVLYSANEKELFKEELNRRAKEHAPNATPEMPKRQSYCVTKGTFKVEKVVDRLKKGKYRVVELTKHAESRGIEFRNVFRGFAGKEIKNFKGYFSTVLAMIMLSSKRAFFKRDDLSRTIGVDTGYIGTFDLEMDEEDRNTCLRYCKLLLE